MTCQRMFSGGKTVLEVVKAGSGDREFLKVVEDYEGADCARPRRGGRPGGSGVGLVDLRPGTGCVRPRRGGGSA